jgi:hypothetical protein
MSGSVSAVAARASCAITDGRLSPRNIDKVPSIQVVIVDESVSDIIECVEYSAI